MGGNDAEDGSAAWGGNDAEDGTAAGGGSDAAGGQPGERDAENGLTDGLLPLFDHTHDRGTTAVVVAFAAVLGLFVRWLVADFDVRFLGFLVGAAGSGYLLYGQPDRRAVLAAGFYSLAALVAAIPIVYELGLVVAVEDPLRHVLSTTDLLFVLVFWLLAAVPALVGYRISTGPLLPRLGRKLG